MTHRTAAGSDTDGDGRLYYDYTNFLTKAERYDTDSWATQAGFVAIASCATFGKTRGTPAPYSRESEHPAFVP